MSTLEQRRGDSFRRQRDASVRYAKKLQLELVEGDEAYADIGVSAYRGRNVKEGALGRFLAAVRAGKISRGSYLLVESLDRVSRETPFDATKTMRDLVEEGINLVDLSDGERLYNKDILRSDTNAFLKMVVRFERAHEESKIKSERLKEAWAAKRDRARTEQIKMTAWCPAWLKLKKDKKGYEVVEKNAAIVRRIFDEAASGLGIFAITRRLNGASVPHFGKSEGWHSSYVVKILKNVAAIGVYRPTKVSGRRATESDWAELSIDGYFPAVIDAALFYRVQNGLAERRHGSSGRKGQAYSNLFTGVRMTCSFCGGPIKFENKGDGPKGGFYLVCGNARRKYSCDAHRWPYQHFEDSFLSFLHNELDFASIKDDDQSLKKSELATKFDALESKKALLNEKLRRRVDLIDSLDDKLLLVPEINALSREIKDLDTALQAVRDEQVLLDEREAAISRGPEQLEELISLLRKPETDLYKTRSRLGKLVRDTVSEISLARGPFPEDEFRHMKWARSDREEVDAGILITRLWDRSEVRNYYVVRFKNDQFRVDVPPNDPLAQPLSGDRERAMAFLLDTGWITIVEKHEVEDFWERRQADPNAPKIEAVFTIETSKRSGTLRAQ